MSSIKDLMKRMFLFGLVAILLFCYAEVSKPNTIAKPESITFQDYRWGQTLADVKKNQLKNKNFIPVGEEQVSYFDKIFGESCSVNLIFTPKSKLLVGVAVIWDTTSVGINLKNLLTKKYGYPGQPNQFMEKYIWLKSKDSIVLNYTFIKTQLFYHNGEYAGKYKQETKEITEKEIDRF